MISQKDETAIAEALLAVAVDVKPTSKVDIKALESEVETMARNAVYETNERMRDFEVSIDSLAL